MRRVVTAINVLALLFSLWWFSMAVVRGHRGDWEFWFALGYLVLCGLNVWTFVRRESGVTTG